MNPLHAAAGAVVVSAFIGGVWSGRHWVQSEWDAEKARTARDVATQLERSMERRAAADKALAGVQSAVASALRSKPYAPPLPIPCPASGDARSVVLPGLGERLRSIDAASGSGAGAGLAIVPESGASDSSR